MTNPTIARVLADLDLRALPHDEWCSERLDGVRDDLDAANRTIIALQDENASLRCRLDELEPNGVTK